MATVHSPRRPVRSVRLALAWVVALFVLLGGPRLDAHGQPFFVVQYWVVSATPTAAGTEFVFRARLLNLGPAIPGLAARLTGSSAAATVLDDTVSFGPVGRFGAAWSTDAASIRRHGRWIDIIKDFRWVFELAAANRPPLASAGPDQSAQVLDRITLDGSGSSDPDGDALTYGWSFVSRPSGSAAVLSDASAARPEFVVDAPGRYVLGLIVHDGTAESAPDFVEVSTINTRPTAHAGADQHVNVGDTAVLDGSASTDADGDPLTYRWSLLSTPAGSAATLIEATSVAPRLTADVPGEYVAQLVVNDGLAESAPDLVLLSTVNVRPVAMAGPDRTTAVGQAVVIDGSGSSDADGDPLTFRWTLVSSPTGSAAAIQAPTAAVTAFTADRPGDYVLQLVVNDGALDSEPDVLVVSTENSPPIADAGPDQPGIVVNTTVALDGSASSDPDGQPLQYSWSLISQPPASGAVLRDADTAFPSFVADAPGAYIAQLIVHDGAQASAPDVVVMTVDERPAVTIVVSDAGASEAGPESGAFEIARTGPTLLPLVVEFAASGAAREGVDYQPLGGRITIPAGAASALLPVAPIDDDLVEGAENVVVTLTAGADYVVVVPGIAGLQIADDDLAAVTIEAIDPDAAEAGFDPGVLRLRRTGDASAPLTVSIGRSGTAIDTDHLPLGAFVTFAAGASTLDLPVVPRADNLVEGPEQLTVTILPNLAYTVGVPGAATVTIADDPVVVSVTASAPTATEAGLVPGSFLYTRSGGNLGAALSISVAIGGTGIANRDYGVLSGVVTFATGQATVPIAVVPLADNVVEAAETVINTINPSAAGTYTLGASSSATVTIVDDPAMVELLALDPDASEAGPDPGAVLLRRTGGDLSAPLNVFFQKSGTATNGLDYQSLGGGVSLVVIPAGQPAATVSVVPIPDALVEGSETAVFTLVANAAYVIGASSSATVTIADAPPVVQ